ncbi:MAG: hypothetical protein Q4F72_09270 [Desulfovibrionaceae bacterium]|nr:hypothetical protein [Desulfovibrionaceae bacterium]
MLRRMLLCAVALLCVPALAHAANDKIDPATYLCAEYQTNEMVLKGQPPLFEGLQIDGYASADVNMDIASADTVHVLLGQVYLWCENRPTEPVYTVWRQLRATGPVPLGNWNAKTSTCGDMAQDMDNASGFIIWLDGYNRRLQNTSKSILNSDEDLQGFIDACMLSPSRTMLEVLQEHAK